MASGQDSYTREPAVTMPSHREARAGGRITGLDVARALAILGMLAVNVGPLDNSGVTGKVLVLPHGRASLLFVLLAGMGYSLLTRRARRGGPVPWQQVLWRAALLILIGLSTQLLDHGIDVILTTYAALFLVALLFVRAPGWVLLGSTGLVTVAGPLLWLTAQGGSGFDREPATLLDPPGQIVASTVLTGPYPVLTWLAPFLFGMWLGRLRLAERGVQVRLMVIGVVVALGAEVLSRVLEAGLGAPGTEPGADWLISGAAHSQMPLWLVAGTAAGVFVLGLALFMEPLMGRWAWPLVATGQLALTVYVVHMVLIVLFVRPGPESVAGGALMTAVLALVLVGAATLWRRFVDRGPLEALLRLRPRLPAR